MSKRPLLIFAALVAVVAAIAWLAFSKEGSDEAVAVPVDADKKRCQEIFATNCGTCHTLAAGGTDGVVGPNLDEILPTQVAPPDGTPRRSPRRTSRPTTASTGECSPRSSAGSGGRMPAGILQDADAEEVSGSSPPTPGSWATTRARSSPRSTRDAAAGGMPDRARAGAPAGEAASSPRARLERGQAPRAGRVTSGPESRDSRPASV